MKLQQCQRGDVENKCQRVVLVTGLKTLKQGVLKPSHAQSSPAKGTPKENKKERKISV